MMYKILIIEDDPIQSLLVQKLIGNHNIDCAYDGLKATQLLNENKYDLVVLDLVLPGDIQGSDLLPLIKESGAKILVATGSSNIVNATKVFQYRPDAYIMKPFSNNLFIDVLKKRLNIGD